MLNPLTAKRLASSSAALLLARLLFAALAAASDATMIRAERSNCTPSARLVWVVESRTRKRRKLVSSSTRVTSPRVTPTYAASFSAKLSCLATSNAPMLPEMEKTAVSTNW